MRTLVFLSTLIATLLPVSVAWSCNKTTYAGCSPEELRAIQQQQFQTRKSPSNDAHQYWRDRQYADRVRSEEQQHEEELEKIRSETEIEVATQQRRPRYYNDHYYYGKNYYYRPSYRPPVVVKPVPPIVVYPRPELKGQVYSNSSYKRVPSAIK